MLQVKRLNFQGQTGENAQTRPVIAYRKPHRTFETGSIEYNRETGRPAIFILLSYDQQGVYAIFAPDILFNAFRFAVIP